MHKPWIHDFPDLFAWEKDLIKNGWKYVGAGRHRRVIRRGNVVIKIPYQFDGMDANRDEYFLYKHQLNKSKNVYYAPCRLLSNGCLMMRFLKTKISNKQYYLLPFWATNMLDGAQVGYDKSGKLMAYDFSEEYE